MSVAPRMPSKFRLPSSALALPRARPICAPLHPSPWITSVQRRTLNLSSLTMPHKSILLGKHTVLEVFRYKPPPLAVAEQLVNLYTPQGEVIAKDVSFEELRNEHVKPGLSLSPRSLPRSDVAEEKIQLYSIASMKTHQVPAKYNNYILTEMEQPPKTSKSPKRPKLIPKLEQNHSGLKAIPMSKKRLMLPLLFRQQMAKIYQFLCLNHPVEVKLVLPGRSVGGVKRSQKNFTLKPELDPNVREEWEWLHTAWPHLHPEIMLKSMPEGTRLWLSPHIHGPSVGWIFGPPKSSFRAWDSKIDYLRHKVTANIRSGKQMEMPYKMRQQLTEAGEIRKGGDLSGKRQRSWQHELEMEMGTRSQRYMVHLQSRRRPLSQDNSKVNRWQGRGGDL